MLRVTDWDIDLQLFAEGEIPAYGETSPAAEHAPAVNVEQVLGSEPSSTPEPKEPPVLTAGALNEFFAKLEAQEAQKETAQAEGGAAETSPAGSTPPAPQAAPTQGAQAPVQAPVQQPVVQIPPDLLTTLGQLAMRALPEPKQETQTIPEPVLPELPEPPDILKGTPEERQAKYYEDPIAFQEALFDHKQQVARVQAERERLTQEHKQKVEFAQRTQAFQQAFAKQVVALGPDTFNQRAEIVQQLFKENPGLMQLPPQQAVELAFRIAEERTKPQPVDVQKLTADQRQALKAAFKQEIIQEYLASVVSGQQQPAVISGSISAGKPPITPPRRPKDLSEAERQWKASFPQ